jgi:hypothetical protein
MKLDVNLSTLLACLVALRVRAVEMQTSGDYDSKWVRAYRELERAAQDAQLTDLAAELYESVFVRH